MDIELLDVLKLHHRLFGLHVLVRLDKPPGDHAVVGSPQRRVAKLDIGLRHPSLEAANRRFLSFDILIAPHGPFLDQLQRRFVIFLRHPVVGFRQVELRPRDGISLQQPGVPLVFGPGVLHAGSGRSHLRFAAHSLFDSLAGSQRPQRRASLIQLSLERLQPGLEIIGPQLGDHGPLGDAIPLLHRQVHNQPRHLKRQFDPLRRFHLARKRP